MEQTRRDFLGVTLAAFAAAAVGITVPMVERVRFTIDPGIDPQPDKRALLVAARLAVHALKGPPEALVDQDIVAVSIVRYAPMLSWTGAALMRNGYIAPFMVAPEFVYDVGGTLVRGNDPWSALGIGGA